jgi:Glycosyltransferase family 87
LSGRLQQFREHIWRLATPQRLQMFLAVYLLTEIGMFAYMESTTGVIDRRGWVRGRDFSTFYITGQIVRDGEADRLYDQEHFLERETELTSIPLESRPPKYSLYPPTVPILFSWLARLEYGDALVAWWLGLVVCFAVAGWWLAREISPAPAWRATTVLAIAAFTPIIYTFLNGQLSAILLLTFIAGLHLHRFDHHFLAGCLLSLLALKPQFAVGPFLWMLLRKDFRTFGGYCLGGVCQVVWSAAVLGPKVLVDYLHNMWTFSHILKTSHPTPDHGHSLGEVLTIVLGNEYVNVCNGVHLAAVVVGAFWFFRTIHPSSRPLAWRVDEEEYQKTWRIEQSALVLFSLLLSPHLLTYDLSMLLIPIAFLLSGKLNIGQQEERWLGGLLWLSAMLPRFYYVIGFSLVPAAMLWTLFRMAQFAKRRQRQEIQFQAAEASSLPPLHSRGAGSPAKC